MAAPLLLAEINVDFSNFLSDDLAFKLSAQILRRYRDVLHSPGGKKNWNIDIDVPENHLINVFRSARQKLGAAILKNSERQVTISRDYMMRVFRADGGSNFIYPSTGIMIPALSPRYYESKTNKSFGILTGSLKSALDSVPVRTSSGRDKVMVSWKVNRSTLSRENSHKLESFIFGDFNQPERPLHDQLASFLELITLKPWLNLMSRSYKDIETFIRAVEDL